MWTRFAHRLQCPISGSPLRLVSFREQQVALDERHVAAAHRAGIAVDAAFSTYVETGVLLSDAGWMYPIVDGVPVLLPYTTAIHERFASAVARELRTVAAAHRFPAEQPAPGEQDVSRSFSEEWREYRYDGVLWDVSYDDNCQRLIEEVGLARPEWSRRTWLEVGCGIGMTTCQAQQLSAADAVGVDLSMAIYKAADQFRSNPFLHYVQASAFTLPFAPGSFDIVYSRGVLHHTYSTHQAFLSMARTAKRGGRVYLWVYGPGSIAASPLRLAAYAAEAALRPVLSRLPTAVASTVLTPVAAAYVGFNAFRRWRQATVQPYTFDRALHAARDRFTPRFAHRQSSAQVMRWFEEAGCVDLEIVDWSRIPAADQDDYRRNTGVRGIASVATGLSQTA
jgi:ubiquinone/menaquinone biosynthesis C-methylase UbiE/uncharacterized protein YbaR (Trm112 family)